MVGKRFYGMDERQKVQAAVQGPLSTDCASEPELLLLRRSRSHEMANRIGKGIWCKWFLFLPLLFWKRQIPYAKTDRKLSI